MYFLIFLIVSPFIPHSAGSFSRSSYGDSCGRFQQCDSNSFLNCANGHFCDCIRPSAMVWDESIKMCVKLVGKKCTGHYNQAPCVSNSICKNGICECVPGFTSLVNGTCGGSLDEKKETADRVQRSHIQIVNFVNHRPVPHGQSCLTDISTTISNLTCEPGLHCRNSYCNCPYKDHQEYDESTKQCITLIGGPCEKNSDCIGDAECVTEEEVKTCKCSKGFSPVDRKCDIAYGEKCVIGDRLKHCDRLGPLECGNKGTCTCSDFQVYDEETLKCKGLVGSKCYLEDEDFCVKGAICKAFRGFRAYAGMGTCVCINKGRVDRTCEI